MASECPGFVEMFLCVMLAYEPRFLEDSDEPLAAIALEYADAKLKADKRIVMAAVPQHGKVLQYADWKLKEDSEVVMAAVSNCRRSFLAALLHRA